MTMDKPAARPPILSARQAPHRPWFAAGTLLGVGAGLWWLSVLTGFWEASAPGSRPPSTAVHAVLWTFGVFPPFIAGFIHTALPRWLRSKSPPPAFDGRSAALYTVGLAWAGAGLLLNLPWATLGWALSTGTWLALTLGVVRSIRNGCSTDRLHAIGVGTAMAMVAFALFTATLACALDQPLLLLAAGRWGLGTGVGVAYAFAAHRMTPFLQPPRENWPPLLTLGAVLSSLGLMTSKATAIVMGAPWPDVLQPVHIAVCATTAVLLVTTALLDPSVRRACRTPMLRHLRRGVFWLCAALVATAMSCVEPVLHHWPGLESAALHMLTLGFMGTTLLAQATRVVATQTGRALVIDRHGEHLHALLQAVVAVRVLGALWPPAAALALPAADLGWTLVLALWGRRWLRTTPKQALTPNGKARPAPPPDRPE